VKLDIKYKVQEYRHLPLVVRGSKPQGNHFPRYTKTQHFKTCLKEHIADTTHNRISKSTIAKHSFKSKHLICFDQTKILASTPYYSSCIIREALEIEKHPNIFNRDDGYKPILQAYHLSPLSSNLIYFNFVLFFKFFPLSSPLPHPFPSKLSLSFYSSFVIHFHFP
jgi:hypothetical protein